MVYFVILFICSIVTLSSGQNCSNDRVIVTKMVFDPGSLGFYYESVIELIQWIRNDEIPYKEVGNLVHYIHKNYQSMELEKLSSKIRPICENQIGVIILLSLGLTFALILPIVGICFCCCRCCNRCGGERYQEKPNETVCAFLSFFLILTLLLMTAGIVVYGTSSENTYDSFDNLGQNLTKIVNSATEYLNHVSDDITCEVSNFDGKILEVKKIIEHYPENIIKKFSEESGADSLKTLLEISQNAESELKSVMDALPSVGVQTVLFNESFAALYQKIDQQAKNDTNLQLPAEPGNIVSKELKLYIIILRQLNANLRNLQENLDQMSSYQLPTFASSTEYSLSEFQSQLEKEFLPKIIPKISESHAQLQNFKSEAQDMTKKIGKVLEKVVETLKEIQEKYDDYKEHDDGLSFFVRFNLPTVLVVIVVLIFIGLLCGCIGFKSEIHPAERSCISNCGGNVLMITVVLMFMFGWLLMADSMITFIFGYGLQYFCQPLFYDPTFRIYPYLNQMIPIVTINGEGHSIDIERAFNICSHNGTLFEAFDLENTFNLNETRQKITNIKLDPRLIDKYLSSDILKYELNEKTQDNLRKMKNKLADFNSSMKKMKRLIDVKFGELTETILDNITQYLEFRSNKSENVRPLINQSATVNQYFAKLQQQSKSISGSSNKILEMANSTTYEIDKILERSLRNVTDITEPIRIEIEETFPRILSTFLTHFDHFQYVLVNEVSSCGQMITIWSNLGTVVCKEIGYPIQGLWSSLALCVLLTVPTIILCVRLAKYLRKMNTENYGEMISAYNKNKRTSFNWPSNGSSRVSPTESGPPPVYVPTERPKRLKRYY